MKQSDAVTYLEKIAASSKKYAHDVKKLIDDLLKMTSYIDAYAALQNGEDIISWIRRDGGSEYAKTLDAVLSLLSGINGISTIYDIPIEYSGALSGLPDIENPVWDLLESLKFYAARMELDQFIDDIANNTDVQSLQSDYEKMLATPDVVDEIIDTYLEYYDSDNVSMDKIRATLSGELNLFVKEFNDLDTSSTNDELYDFINRYEEFVDSIEQYVSNKAWGNIEKSVYPLFDKARKFVDNRPGAGSPNGGAFGMVINGSYDMLNKLLRVIGTNFG